MRSEEESSRDQSAEVILLDSVGELRAVFPLAEIVFVGGSLIPHGGQNILEPAIEKKPIVTGFYTMNFAEIVKEFLAQDALVQLPELNENEAVATARRRFFRIAEQRGTTQRVGRKCFCHCRKKSRRDGKNSRISSTLSVCQQKIMIFVFYFFALILVFLGYKSLRGGIDYLNYLQKRTSQTAIKFHALLFDNRAVSRTRRRFANKS